MCGIAGACWTAGSEPLSEVILKRMTDALVHRGPDDDGVYSSLKKTSGETENGSGAVLGFRRLSIIDLAGGHQPLSNEDGTVWIAFNGEVYNYRELKPELERLGHRFRTSSDTECIVHAYEQWGRDAGVLHHEPRELEWSNWIHAGSMVRRDALIMTEAYESQPPLITAHEDWFV